MRKISIIAVILTVAMFGAGCEYGGTGDDGAIPGPGPDCALTQAGCVTPDSDIDPYDGLGDTPPSIGGAYYELKEFPVTGQIAGLVRHYYYYIQDGTNVRITRDGSERPDTQITKAPVGCGGECMEWVMETEDRTLLVEELIGVTYSVPNETGWMYAFDPSDELIKPGKYILYPYIVGEIVPSIVTLEVSGDYGKRSLAIKDKCGEDIFARSSFDEWVDWDIRWMFVDGDAGDNNHPAQLSQYTNQKVAFKKDPASSCAFMIYGPLNDAGAVYELRISINCDGDGSNMLYGKEVANFDELNKDGCPTSPPSGAETDASSIWDSLRNSRDLLKEQIEKKDYVDSVRTIGGTGFASGLFAPASSETAVPGLPRN